MLNAEQISYNYTQPENMSDVVQKLCFLVKIAKLFSHGLHAVHNANRNQRQTNLFMEHCMHAYMLGDVKQHHSNHVGILLFHITSFSFMPMI